MTDLVSNTTPEMETKERVGGEGCYISSKTPKTLAHLAQFANGGLHFQSRECVTHRGLPIGNEFVSDSCNPSVFHTSHHPHVFCFALFVYF